MEWNGLFKKWEALGMEGVWTAIVTPFVSDGSIDWLGLERLLDTQAAAGISGIVLSGTTGEAPCLTSEEKIKLIQFAKKTLPSNMQIMAGVGGNSTSATLESATQAATAGADSLLVVTPPYNKPGVRGLLAHFDLISSQVDLPICLYHVPSRTGQILTGEEIASITAVKRVTAVKEASADLKIFTEAIRLSPRSVSYLSGDDFTFLPSMAVGSTGVISVISNIFPRALVEMRNHFLQGRLQNSVNINQTLYPLMEKLFIEPNPTPVKWLLHRFYGFENEVRLPLVGVTKRSSELLNETYHQVKKGLEEHLN